MEERNIFKDYRVILLNLINIFEFKEPLRKRNSYFEEEIQQIIFRKSINNFELFVLVFDEIRNKKVKEMDEERTISQYAKKFNKDTNNQDIRRTIRMAMKVNSYVKELSNKSLIKMKNPKFDIFLSHRYLYKFYNLVVYYILTVYYDLEVYIDWIFDDNLNRNEPTKETTLILQNRLNQSETLIFFNIDKRNTTNWMAWEVGYFRALKRKIAILDLNNYCKGSKNVEVLSSSDILLSNTQGRIYEENTQLEISQWVFSKSKERKIS